MPVLPEIVPQLLIPVASIAGILFALFTWWRVSFIKVGAASGTRTNGEEGRTFLLEEELAGEESVRNHSINHIRSLLKLGNAGIRSTLQSGCLLTPLGCKARSSELGARLVGHSYASTGAPCSRRCCRRPRISRRPSPRAPPPSC